MNNKNSSVNNRMVIGRDLEYQKREILDSISRNIDQAAILIFAQQLAVCLRPDHTVEESFFLASIRTLVNLNHPRIDGFSGEYHDGFSE